MLQLRTARALRPATFLLVAALCLPALARPAFADSRADLDAALAAIKSGDLDAAEAAAGRVGDGDPWYAEAAFCKAWVLAKRGDAEHAATAYAKVVELQPQNARAWNNYGVVLDDLGRFEEALTAYDRCIALDPKYAAAQNNRGVTLDKIGEGRRAAEAFHKAIEIDPQYAAPHNNLGAWLYESGDVDAASQSWARAASLDPSYVSPIVNRAVMEFEGDKPSVAEVRLENLVKAGRATADVWFNLGVFAYRRGLPEKALKCMEEADALRPHHPETLNNLGVLYLRSEDGGRRAERALRACIELDPKMPKAWDNLGLTLYRDGRHAEAREAFEKEVELAPTDSFAHYNLGCALAAEGREADAAAAFRKATELEPGNVEALHNLAVLMSERPDRDAAQELALYRRVLSLDERYAPVHLSLGRFYQSEPAYKDLQKAYDHYDRYVRLERHDLDTVAEITRVMKAIRLRLEAGEK